MLEPENMDPGDAKLISEFESENPPTKESSLEVVSAPPPREALVSDYRKLVIFHCMDYLKLRR